MITALDANVLLDIVALLTRFRAREDVFLT